MIDQIKTDLKNLLIKAGVASPPDFTTPPNADMGDFALPCFTLAKEQKKSPQEVANAIVDALDKSEWEKYELLQDVAAEGPYVNFFLKNSILSERVIEAVRQERDHYGYNKRGAGKKVLLEYPGENTHKEFHIGHLRNVCIGNALVELYRANGYEPIVVNYLNNFGANVAKCLWGLDKFHAGEMPPENPQKWLGQVYKEANAYITDHPEVKLEVEEVQRKLEARDPELWPLFEQTLAWSVSGFERIHQELGVRHVQTFFESDVKDTGQAIVDDLLKKGVATVGERGAIIVDLSQYGLEVALLRKSNGAGLYMTADLALAEEKFKQFDAAESVYITAFEQDFQFKQLFKVLELAGFKKKLIHIGYGLVNLPEGKMSSRLGNVVLYDDLKNEVVSLLLGESKERHPEWSVEKLDATVTTIALAALKFSMQQHEAGKTITFDAKQAVSFEGFSAPYILYSIARILSVFKKTPIEYQENLQTDYALLVEPEEKKLVIMIARYSTALQKALDNHNPSVITAYCFELAQAFNDFYTKHTILNAGDASLLQTRLALALAVQQVLRNGLGILTIDVVDEM